MTTTTLSAEHFLEDNLDTILNNPQAHWGHVRCFHATRLPNKESIRQEGLRLPSEESLGQLLGEAGIEEIDTNKLMEVIETNGRAIFFQMNEQWALTHCNYHSLGAEKIRKYVKTVCPERWDSVRDLIATWKPFIVRLKIPITYFDSDDIWRDLAIHPRDPLHTNIGEVDVTLESPRDIPLEFIEEVRGIEEAKS